MSKDSIIAALDVDRPGGQPTQKHVIPGLRQNPKIL
jgi:hypothetical protein